MATRQTDWIDHFWKALAHDPATLRPTWGSVKQIMSPGALDPLTRELICVAVSPTKQCGYCIPSHTAGTRKAGMPDSGGGKLIVRSVSEKQRARRLNRDE
jgi:AhpD family alkylhydroperoxidase